MRTLSLLLFLTAMPLSQALACSPPPPVAEQEARAESVQIGYVVGEVWPDYEARLLAGDKSYPRPERRLVRVVFTEALKGALSPPREVRVPCSAPFPVIRDRVIVSHHPEGDFLVGADFPGYEQALRAALLRGR